MTLESLSPMHLQHQPLRLVPLAMNHGRLASFAPYVPAVDDSGRVAFQSTLANGHSALLVHDGAGLTTWASTEDPSLPVASFCSHPDLHPGGQVCAYATLRDGSQALACMTGPGQLNLLGRPPQLAGIGPLGPTMNRHDQVAVRGLLATGRSCVALIQGLVCQVLAQEDAGLKAFEGLPVVNDSGQVAFKAQHQDGSEVVALQTGQARVIVARSGGAMAEIRPFVTLDNLGRVGFAAADSNGQAALFLGGPGGCQRLAGSDEGFESYRGLLVNDQGPVVFYGTPIGGTLGIYCGPHPVQHRLLGLGDAWEGGIVSGFALNPVSVNAHGQIAVRLALADGREFILRGDPS